MERIDAFAGDKMNNSKNRRDSRFFSGDEKQLNEIRKKQSLQKFAKKWRSRKRASRVMSAGIFAAIIFIFILVCLSMFFRVKNIELVGSSRYTAEQIIEYSQVELGESLFGITASDFDGAIERLPYINSVKVTRKLPDTIIITAIEDEPRYASVLYGENFIFSRGLRVLEQVADKGEFLEQGLIELKLPQINSAIIGEGIEFSKEVSHRYVKAYLNALETSPLYSKATAFDLRDRFSVALIASDKYLIQLGNGDELATKLTAVAGILDHTVFADGIPAKIDATDPTQCPVIKDPNFVAEFDD